MAVFLFWCAPAWAIVGEAHSDAVLEAHTVMVLRAGAAAGFCSGVVVARDVVLTAAHCVSRADDMRVHWREAGAPVLRTVREVVVHPGYRANAARLRVRSIDLALVRLSEPLPARFMPAALDERGLALGDAVRIAGYGVAREGAAASSGVLRVAVLAARAPLSNILLWAQDAAHQGAGACTGDSGGPIFAADTATVVAVTDWATGVGGHCGALTQGALVAPQRTWIEDVMRRWLQN